MVRQVLLPHDIILLSVSLWLECGPMGLTARETGKYYLTLCQEEKRHRCQCCYKLEIYLQFSDFLNKIKTFYYFLRYGPYVVQAGLELTR